jgi:hypothetical protein
MDLVCWLFYVADFNRLSVFNLNMLEIKMKIS